jgi:hypothetical protein
MGAIPAERIELGARVILSRLADPAVASLRYSELLVPEEDCYLPSLCREMLTLKGLAGPSLEAELADWIYSGTAMPETFIQFAAEQLREAGLLDVDYTGEPLPYEEKDFVMRLTESGRAFIAGGGHFEAVYVDM